MSPPARSQGRCQPDLFRSTEPRRQFDLAQAVRGVWHSGIDPSGTLTAQYLARLGLSLPDDVRGRVIRHHGSLAFAKDKRMAGVLMVLRDLKDDQPVAVVRTYLDADARKVAQRVLGPAFRAAAIFDPGEHAHLHVAIGVDAGIRARALNYRPLWAVASTEALANLQLPVSVEVLTILIQTADGNVMRAATAATARLESASRGVRIIEIATKPATPKPFLAGQAREAARP
jgi:putative DNA primase/helicase